MPPEEAMEETLKMLEVYRDIAEDILAIPVIMGEKSPGESDFRELKIPILSKR